VAPTNEDQKAIATFGPKRQSQGAAGMTNQETQRKRQIATSVFGEFRQSI
jgi:hypothetical protein